MNLEKELNGFFLKRHNLLTIQMNSGDNEGVNDRHGQFDSIASSEKF